MILILLMSCGCFCHLYSEEIAGNFAVQYHCLMLHTDWYSFLCSVSAHHKSKEALEHRNPLLQWYYSIYPLFGYCCVGTELFYILLYVLHHFPHPLISQVKKWTESNNFEKIVLFLPLRVPANFIMNFHEHAVIFGLRRSASTAVSPRVF